MTKYKEEILLRVNYTANNEIEAEKRLKQLTKDLTLLVKIKEFNKPILYWKDKTQYQILYKLCESDQKSSFLKIRDKISRNWDISKENEAIWNGIKDKREFFLHPTVKWAHLEAISYD